MSPFQRKTSFLVEAAIVSFIIGCIIPSIFLLKALINRQEVVVGNFLFGFVFSFTATFCIYFFNTRIVKKIQGLERFFNSPVRRIFIELLITISTSGIVMTIVYMAFLNLSGYTISENVKPLFDNILIAVIVNVIVVALIEVLFLLENGKIH